MLLNLRNTTRTLISFIAVVGFASNSFAAGYEKAVQWSAKWSALGGNAAAGVKGADATYFNPAGLVGGADIEATFNLSPTFSTFNGPVDPVTNTKESGDQQTSPIFGVGGKYALTPDLHLGAMYYVSGGTKALLDNVPVGAAGGFDFQAELAVTEFALGLGYKLNENLNLGFAWRSVFVEGSLKSASYASSPLPAGSVNATELTNLEDTSFGGFKLGAQYAKDNWGMGFTYRNSIDFEAEGDGSITNSAAGVIVPEAENTVKNSLPEAITLDGFYELNMPLVLYFGYTFTKYSTNDALEVDGPVGSALAAAGFADGIPQDWADQHNYRFGAEYKGYSMPIRFGYVLTSQVTDDDAASATYASPGMGHTLTVGSGTNLGSGVLDFAVEYSAAEGKDKTAYYGAQGDFDTTAYALHFSYNMAF